MLDYPRLQGAYDECRQVDSRWAVPLAIALSLPVSIIVGHEVGGDSPGLRILYGGVAGVIVALAVIGVFKLLARREPGA